MAKRHERTDARRSALALLYTSEITDEEATKIADEGRFLAEEGVLTEYAHALVRGVDSHRATIDKHLAATSENWALTRMPIVDRSILRLATYEMMFVDDVPTSVTINEAVELAKEYGGEDESHRFVNGILGRIARMLGGEPLEVKAPLSEADDASKQDAPEPEISEPEISEPADEGAAVAADTPETKAPEPAPEPEPAPAPSEVGGQEPLTSSSQPASTLDEDAALEVEEKATVEEDARGA